MVNPHLTIDPANGAGKYPPPKDMMLAWVTYLEQHGPVVGMELKTDM